MKWFGAGGHRVLWPDRRLVEHHARIDAYALARDGMLIAGTVSELRWTNGIAATIRAEPTRLAIIIGDRQQFVALDPKQCGAFIRAGLRCPSCRRRIIHLYEIAGAFTCRKCADIDYRSRHSKRDRWATLSRIAKLRRQINADLSPLAPLPPRPRWNTSAAKYDRVAAEIARLEKVFMDEDRHE
jgi:hypothetical protein